MTTNENKQTEAIDGFIPEQIEFQLDSIIRSTSFKASIQMQNFLRYVVHKRLLGQQTLLKQYTIAVEALGQEEDFDPESNPLIRIEAGRLRKKLTEYYETVGKNDFCIVSIPVGRYVPAFEKNENADAESTPDREALVEQAITTTTATGWEQSCGPRLLLSCFTGDQVHKDESTKVLRYIADNLSFVMSQFLLFQLIAANPCADKRISEAVIDSYQESDKADYILTVAIHHVQSKEYQLVLQLVETRTKEIIWSDTHALFFADLEKQQQNVCNKVTAAVVDLLQGAMHVHWARRLLQEGESSIDPRHKVLAFYRYFSDQLTNQSFRVAVEACQQAIEKHPGDVIAHIVYCEYCRQEHVYARGVIDNPLAAGLKSGQLATRHRSDSHEAHYVLGQIWFHLGYKELCIIAFEQSQRLSRHNPQITFGYGFHLFFMEKWDEAMSCVAKVLSSVPAHPDWYHTLPFLNHYRLGEYDKALLEAQQITSPSVFWGPLSRAVVYGQLNQTDLAKVECDELLVRYPDFEKSGLQMLKRYLTSELLFDAILDGLKKSGMKFMDV